MIRNKLNKRILAGALTLAVALPLFVTNVAKADNTLENGRVDYYTFDSQSLKNDGSSKAQAEVFGKAWAEASISEASFVEGRSGAAGDYAIDLSKHGLKLNDKNIGDNFTVSAWVKPTGNFISWAQNMVFLGYHNPEKWVAAAGTGGSYETVFWSNDKVNNLTSWTQFAKVSLKANEWNNVILMGDGVNMSYYLNGNKVFTTATVNPLTGENQDVHVGVDNWDDLFPGYADDIMVYNRTLSLGEINQINTGKSLADVLNEDATAVAEVEVMVGREMQSDLTLDAIVAGDATTEISYKIVNESIASVDEKGVVTGIKPGETTLKVTVKAGGATKTVEAAVKVVAASIEDFKVADYSFENEIVNAVANAGTASLKQLVSQGNWADFDAPVYADGKGEGKGLQLNGYGLKLNVGQVGKNYTVSFDVKVDKSLAENQVVFGMGNFNPENWFAISGARNGAYKAWLNGGSYSWTTQYAPVFTAGQWTNVTMVGTDGMMTMYMDGVQVAEFTTNNPLAVDGADVYMGINNWDVELDGCIDNVKVYRTALTAKDVSKLVFGKTAEDILAETELTVADVEVRTGATAQINVELPDAVASDASTTVTYESKNDKIATVDETGLVTGVKKGDAVVTVTVTNGEATKTADIKVTVIPSNISEYLVGEYDFNGNLDNKVADGAAPVAKELKSQGNWADYSNVKYSEGYDGQAVQLNGYGLKMNVGRLGKEFTVSFGVKMDKNLATNQIMMTTGHHSPENWFAISGEGGAGGYKVWGNGGALTTWTTRFAPTFEANQWYQITMVGTDGKVTLYINGKSQGTQNYNNPMDVENADIYFGVNNWDTEFDGAFDNVKIYSTALSQAEVESIDFVAVSKMAEASLTSVMNSKATLGDNTSESEIKFNLNLPKKVMGYTVTIESSDADVIALDGTVTNPRADKDVKVTAKVNINGVDTTVEKTYTVKAIDRTELNALLDQAKAVDVTYLTTVCKTKLAAVIEEGENAASFTEIDEAIAHITYVLEHLEYTGVIVDPFAQIVEPKVYTTLNVGDAPVKFFTLPESIKDMVEVAYTTGNADVATVEDGVITPVAEGKTIVTATVTAKADGYKVEYSTATEVKDLRVLSVTASADKTKLRAGETAKVSAQVTAGGSADKAVEFRSSNELAATVSADGTVTPVANGKTTITVSSKADSTKFATVEITVVGYIESLSVSADKTLVKKGETAKLTATVEGAEADQTVVLTSSDEKVATVSADGTVTPVANGKTTITVATADGSKTKQIEITVEGYVEEVKAEAPKDEVKPGETAKIDADVIGDGADQAVEFVSSDETVAKVLEDGTIVPLKNGTVEVKVASKADPNKFVVVSVTITGFAEKVEIITDKKVTTTNGVKSIKITKKETAVLTTIVTPDNTLNKAVVWTSSDESIAKVDATGLVTPIKKGKVTIKATSESDGTVYDELVINVTNPAAAANTPSASNPSVVETVKTVVERIVQSVTNPGRGNAARNNTAVIADEETPLAAEEETKSAVVEETTEDTAVAETVDTADSADDSVAIADEATPQAAEKSGSMAGIWIAIIAVIAAALVTFFFMKKRNAKVDE